MDKKKIDVDAYYISALDKDDTIILKESITDRALCYLDPYTFKYNSFGKSYLIRSLLSHTTDAPKPEHHFFDENIVKNLKKFLNFIKHDKNKYL